MVLGLSIFLMALSALMILLVLLHKGKGSGLSDLFGGGVSSNYGGSSVVEWKRNSRKSRWSRSNG